MRSLPNAVPSRRRIALVSYALPATSAILVAALVSARALHAEPPPPAPSAPPAPTAAPPSPPFAPAAPLPPLQGPRATILDELGRAIEVYPPLDGRPGAPLTVFLHATCMEPAPVCDRIGRAGRDGAFLVCPSGNDSCSGAPDWHGTGNAKSAFLGRDLARVEQRFGAYITHDDTLVGWSRGAFAAKDILYDDVARGAPPRFSSLVLVAADVFPDPVKLKAAGIKRVLMASGDRDGSRLNMQHATAKLVASGIPARFVSLGPIGHWWPEDFEERMAPGMAWVRGR